MTADRPFGSRAWRRYWIDDPIDGAWKTGLHHALRLLSIDRGSDIGARLGELMGTRIHKVWDKRARNNYRRLKPKTDPAELDAIIRMMWRNIGRSMTEFSAEERLWPAGRVESVGHEPALAAQAAGIPVICAALHLANWEACGIAYVGTGFKGGDIFQPPRNRFEAKLAVAARNRLTKEHDFIPPGPSSARQVYRILAEERRAMLIYVDEHFGGRVQAPAFGRTLTTKGNLAKVVRLALTTDALIVPVYTERLGDAARLRVTFEPPFPVEKTGNRDADIAANVARLDAHIAGIILPRLEQWYYLHELRFDR